MQEFLIHQLIQSAETVLIRKIQILINDRRADIRIVEGIIRAPLIILQFRQVVSGNQKQQKKGQDFKFTQRESRIPHSMVDPDSKKQQRKPQQIDNSQMNNIFDRLKNILWENNRQKKERCKEVQKPIHNSRIDRALHEKKDSLRFRKRLVGAGKNDRSLTLVLLSFYAVAATNSGH